MTAAQLRKAEARYRRAFAASEAARAARNAVIREAVAEGWTHARLAETLGVSRSRAGQLAKEATR
jgi:hypothetical protein